MLTLRIWGSGVRIPPSAPTLSPYSAPSFCSPFCRICCYDVLELGYGAFCECARSRQILVENVLRPPQRVSGDRHNFRDVASRLGKQRYGGPPKIMEMKISNPRSFACLLPLLRKVSLTVGPSRFRRQNDSGASWGSIERSLQSLRAGHSNDRGFSTNALPCRRMIVVPS